MLAVSIFEVLENLCTALQGKHTTVAGMLQAVEHTTARMTTLRSDESYNSLYSSAQQIVEQLNLDAICLPRQSRPPRKREYTTTSSQHTFDNPAAYFKPIYFTAIDTAQQSKLIRSRFDQYSFTTVKELEECLVTGQLKDTLKLYPEVDVTRLAVQLPMFRSSYDYCSVDQATAALRSCRPEVKQLFCEVEKLLRLLLVLRVSSCEAERSFSSLRRLKTYLRSTMTQQRLNSVAVLHVYQRKLMSVSLDDILKDFISLNSQRMQTFGTMQ